MRLLILTIGLLLSGAVNGQNMKPLTPEERRVIVDKGTEAPFTGRHYDHPRAGGGRPYDKIKGHYVLRNGKRGTWRSQA